MAHLAIDADLAAALLAEAVGHAETEPGALPFRLGREERLERAIEHLAPHAGAGAGHGQHHVLAGRQVGHARHVAVVEHRVGKLEREPAAVGHRVARVDGEVQHHFLELMRIDLRVPEAARHHRLDLDRFAERLTQQFVDVAQQPRRADDRRLQRLAAAEREQVGCQPRAAIDPPPRRARDPAAARRRLPALCHFFDAAPARRCGNQAPRRCGRRARRRAFPARSGSLAATGTRDGTKRDETGRNGTKRDGTTKRRPRPSRGHAAGRRHGRAGRIEARARGRQHAERALRGRARRAARPARRRR